MNSVKLTDPKPGGRKVWLNGKVSQKPSASAPALAASLVPCKTVHTVGKRDWSGFVDQDGGDECICISVLICTCLVLKTKLKHTPCDPNPAVRRLSSSPRSSSRYDLGLAF